MSLAPIIASFLWVGLALLLPGVIARHIRRRRRDRLAAAALTGLLADHLDHADECEGDETCEQAVARLAVKHADAVIAKLDEP